MYLRFLFLNLILSLVISNPGFSASNRKDISNIEVLPSSRFLPKQFSASKDDEKDMLEAMPLNDGNETSEEEQANNLWDIASRLINSGKREEALEYIRKEFDSFRSDESSGLKGTGLSTASMMKQIK